MSFSIERQDGLKSTIHSIDSPKEENTLKSIFLHFEVTFVRKEKNLSRLGLFPLCGGTHSPNEIHCAIEFYADIHISIIHIYEKKRTCAGICYRFF